MMKKLALVMALALCSSYANAELATDVTRCRSIAENSARLACYDQLQIPGAPAAAQNSAPVANAAPVAPITPAAEFGADSLKRSVLRAEADHQAAVAVEADSISSELVGPFKGWDPKTRFELRNGQVWKNVGGDSVYQPGNAQNVRVTVEKGALGSYYLSFEGLNRRAKVRRVK